MKTLYRIICLVPVVLFLVILLELSSRELITACEFRLFWISSIPTILFYSLYYEEIKKHFNG